LARPEKQKAENNDVEFLQPLSIMKSKPLKSEKDRMNKEINNTKVSFSKINYLTVIL